MTFVILRKKPTTNKALNYTPYSEGIYQLETLKYKLPAQALCEYTPAISLLNSEKPIKANLPKALPIP